MPSVLAYDAQRYWVDTIRVGPRAQPLLKLDYDQVFGYDKLHRLTSVTGTGGYPSASFAYDAHGNRSGGGFSYDSNRFRLKSLNGFGTLMYDNNGNLTHHSAGRSSTRIRPTTA